MLAEQGLTTDKKATGRGIPMAFFVNAEADGQSLGWPKVNVKFQPCLDFDASDGTASKPYP